MRKLLTACLMLVSISVSAADAQVKAALYAEGFVQPLAFVQDPSNRTIQYVVEKGGHIRVIRDGEVLPDDFLDISDQVATESELGLLGLAFSPNYANDGRFWVFFSNVNAHSVVARFTRSAADPLRADMGSRFDLMWPDGNRFIEQPSPNHKGGHMAFGPDGYLYVGTGDGTARNDELHLAQNARTLYGKMLRLDVSVGDGDWEGYDVPADNPFVGQDDILPQIWALGLRNPWRWSFDDPARGGTGALVIADVGQGEIEEIDYVPFATASGRNYGWRLYEGTHEFDLSQPGFPGQLTGPIFEYDHSVGRSVTGGFVYRGSALGAANVGRYFFADFVRGRVWSLGLSLDGAGQATAVDLAEHTQDINIPDLMPSSFGADADGEIYLVSYATGQVFRLTPGSGPIDGPSDPLMQLETPISGPSGPSFVARGWAIDRGSALGPGIDAVHVWAIPTNGSPAIFLGESGGLERPDIAAQYGAKFLHAGFSVAANNVPSGEYVIVAYAHSSVTHAFQAQQMATVRIGSRPLLYIDLPSPYATFSGRFPMGGWAVDLDASSGTGVSEIQVFAQRPGEDTRFLGSATLGVPRPDIGAAFGGQFTNSGWTFVGGELPPDTWTITAYMRSSLTGTFVLAQTVIVTLTDGLTLWVDSPTPHQVLPPGPNHISGWVLDSAAIGTTGVSALHMWALPSDGAPAVFLGLATTGLYRPDVAAAFGSQFAHAGFDCPFDLPPGEYDVIVYPIRSTTNTPANAQSIHIRIGGS